MTTRIHFTHPLFFVYDSAERAPEHDWTDAHVAQGFARRTTSVNVSTLIEHGWLEVELGTAESVDRCERVVIVSIRSDSGAIAIGGTDPEDHVLWRGRPGWVRVAIGQMLGTEDLQLRVLVHAEEAAAEEPTRVKDRGEWVAGELVETAEVVRL